MARQREREVGVGSRVDRWHVKIPVATTVTASGSEPLRQQDQF